MSVCVCVFFKALQCNKPDACCRKYIADRPHLPWVSLYCAGFADSPVGFGHREHTVGMSGAGDNAYVIVLGGNGDYLLTTVCGSNKMMK